MTIHRKNKISTYSYMCNSEWIKIRDDFYDTNPPFDSTVRKELFREVYIFLQELNINAWITGGTLLGAVRDNDFIEWDDDIDLDLLESSFLLNMYDIREGLIQLGYIVRLIDDTEYPKMVVYKNSMKIAIGSLKESNDMLLRPCYKLPVKFFKVDKTISFMGLLVLAPHPPEDYLTYVYGKGWSKPKHVEDDTQLYTIKYLRRSSIRVVLKRFYLIVKKFFQ
jgi:hypothetical protein